MGVLKSGFKNLQFLTNISACFGNDTT